MTILYITQNGVTDHIGRSQVAPYLMGLTRRGYDIHVLSAEKPDRGDLVSRYAREFESAGIAWTRVAYRNSPKYLGQARTQWDLRAAARDITRRESIELVHCRSFPPALIGWELKRAFGVKFIFDFRDFYADGGIAKASGLQKLLSRGLKRVEGPMIRAADKIVCLTDRAASLLGEFYLSDRPDPASQFQVVPCCADYRLFEPAAVSEADKRRARQKARLSESDFVLIYLGSLGPDYLLEQMLKLFAQVMAARPSAKFLFLANNGEELVAKSCDAQGVPRERIAFVSADRDEVPAFLCIADLSVIFIRADLSKAGCSPTKLAELFACNVPVIANSGVGDMDRIIDLERNGSAIVGDFSDEALRAAVEKVLAPKRATNIRENSREFDLEAGVERYATVYAELLQR
jgi:glycosyltransferase involved in cell wall biosynthesis